MMTVALASEALAHVHATEALLLAHPTAVAGKHWRRAILALGYAEDALEEGRQALEGARLQEPEAEPAQNTSPNGPGRSDSNPPGYWISRRVFGAPIGPGLAKIAARCCSVLEALSTRLKRRSSFPPGMAAPARRLLRGDEQVVNDSPVHVSGSAPPVDSVAPLEDPDQVPEVPAPQGH